MCDSARDVQAPPPPDYEMSKLQMYYAGKELYDENPAKSGDWWNVTDRNRDDFVF
jgi:hypothetical protein